MAVTYLTGLEAQHAAIDAITTVGTAAYSTAQARTGVASLRCNPASAAAGYCTVLSGPYVHFAIYVATMPTSQVRLICGNNTVGRVSVGLQADGSLTVLIGTNTLVGNSSAGIITTGKWYWFGVRQVTGTSVVFVQVDGADVVTGTATVTDTSAWIGVVGTQAGAVDVYIDDIVIDDTGFLAPSKVALLVPISDNAVGTGWTLGTGTAISANSGSTAVKNTPPLGVADLTAGSDTKQIRNATANANVSYVANLTTYSTAGVGASDTVLALQPIVATAAPVTTSSKQGTVGVASNPAITDIALGAGGTAGAFWSGLAGGVYPSGWKISTGTLTTSPSVTVGTSPAMRVTQVTSSNRVAMVCFMGMNVAWTPAVVAGLPDVITGGGYYS